MANSRLCIPLGLWPAADRAKWIEGMRPRKRFRTAASSTKWSASTLDKTERGFGRYLRYLADVNRLDPEATPGDRITPELVDDYVEHLEGYCAPRTIVNRLQELRDALRVLAPEAEIRWLTDLYLVLDREALPCIDKRSRLKPPGELLALGEAMMREAENAIGWSTLRRARQYRDGLMIAFRAYRPIRMKNMASIRIGTQLVNEAAGWWLTFTEAEMKNRRRFSAPFPEQLAPALERYIAVHRPVLVAAHSGNKRVKATDALWVSDLGTMFTQKAMSKRIADHVEAALGVRIPPHWFRDCVATTIAIENSAHVADVPIVLGHHDPKTSHKYYIQANGLEASRRLGKALAAFREVGKIDTDKPEAR